MSDEISHEITLLEELALKHVQHRRNHPNDLSGYILSKMLSRFGRTKTVNAIDKMEKAMNLLSGQILVTRAPALETKIRGREVTFRVLDDILEKGQ